MKINVLHLRSSVGFYGAENVIFNLAREHKDKGIATTVAVLIDRTYVSSNNPNEFIRRCQLADIKTVEISCRGKLDSKAIAQLHCCLLDKNINVLHAHGYKSDFLGLLAATELDIVKVATNHLWTSDDLKIRFYELIDRFVLNGYDQVVAVSNPIAKQVRPWLIDKKKLSVISNGINIKQYTPTDDSEHRDNVRRSFNLNSSDFVIGIVGRLSDQKGHVYLIQALSLLVRENSNIKLLIVGGGIEKESLKRQVKAAGLTGNVIFSGVQKDMKEVYSIIDVLAMPSLKEGLPIALLEAIAMNVSVVASNVGDIPKIIKDGQTGFLVTSKDVASLKKAIMRLFNDKKQGLTFAENARKLVEDEYSSGIMAYKYSEIYKKCLNIKKKMSGGR